MDTEWAMGTAFTSRRSKNTSTTSSITSSWCARSIRRSQSSLSDTRWWVELLQMKFFFAAHSVSEIDRYLDMYSCLFLSRVEWFSCRLHWRSQRHSMESSWWDRWFTSIRTSLRPSNSGPPDCSAVSLLTLRYVPHLFLSILRGEFWPAVFLFLSGEQIDCWTHYQRSRRTGIDQKRSTGLERRRQMQMGHSNSWMPCGKFIQSILF